jgi:hypothetical protein
MERTSARRSDARCANPKAEVQAGVAYHRYQGYAFNPFRTLRASALFRGRRSGGFGLIRDLHDLLTMAAAVRGCWTALLQGARERRDGSLESVCRACDGETARQVAWIETKLRQASPQALTVPPDTVRELGASLPNRADVAAIFDLVPGSAIRRVVPLAPITTALVALAVILPLAWTNARRRR